MRPTITAMPAVRSPRDVVKNRVRLLFGWLFLLTFLSVFALLSGGGGNQVVAEKEEPFGAEIAQVEVTSWLRGTERPTVPRLPLTATGGPYVPSRGGDIGPVFVIHQAATPIRFPTASTGELPGWMHRFFVLPQNPSTAAPFYVDVPVSGTSEADAAIAGPPTITPYIPPPAGRPLALAFTAQQSALPDVAVARLKTWANALFGGDEAALAEISGRAVGEAVPIRDFVVAGDPTVLEVVQPNPQGSIYLARVQVPIALAPREDVEFTASQVFDVVIDISGTSPLVVAWGPAGTGPALIGQ